jgi:preprotein translocase subunit SecE
MAYSFLSLLMLQLKVVNPVSFLKEVKTELDKVIWPNRKQTIEMTVLVIVVSLVIGLYVGGLDFLFTSLINTLLKR